MANEIDHIRILFLGNGQLIKVSKVSCLIDGSFPGVSIINDYCGVLKFIRGDDIIEGVNKFISMGLFVYDLQQGSRIFELSDRWKRDLAIYSENFFKVTSGKSFYNILEMPIYDIIVRRWNVYSMAQQYCKYMYAPTKNDLKIALDGLRLSFHLGMTEQYRLHLGELMNNVNLYKEKMHYWSKSFSAVAAISIFCGRDKEILPVLCESLIIQTKEGELIEAESNLIRAIIFLVAGRNDMYEKYLALVNGSGTRLKRSIDIRRKLEASDYTGIVDLDYWKADQASIDGISIMCNIAASKMITGLDAVQFFSGTYLDVRYAD